MVPVPRAAVGGECLAGVAGIAAAHDFTSTSRKPSTGVHHAAGCEPRVCTVTTRGSEVKEPPRTTRRVPTRNRTFVW